MQKRPSIHHDGPGEESGGIGGCFRSIGGRDGRRGRHLHVGFPICAMLRLLCLFVSYRRHARGEELKEQLGWLVSARPLGFCVSVVWMLRLAAMPLLGAYWRRTLGPFSEDHDSPYSCLATPDGTVASAKGHGVSVTCSSIQKWG